jgi:hypothetical protein
MMHGVVVKQLLIEACSQCEAPDCENRKASFKGEGEELHASGVASAVLPAEAFPAAGILFNTCEQNNISPDAILGAFSLILSYVSKKTSVSIEDIIVRMVANLTHLDRVPFNPMVLRREDTPDKSSLN